MENVKNKNYLKIRIVGSKNGEPLKPENYDFKELLSVLEVAKDILLTQDSGNYVISYKMRPGSVIHEFRTDRSLILVIATALSMIINTNSLDNVGVKVAGAIEKIQKISQRSGYAFEMSTSEMPRLKLKIDKDTSYTKVNTIWVDSEFYFYGKIVDAGGKLHSNIHVDTDEHGIVKIGIPQEILKELPDNLLYKDIGVRAKGKQNLQNFEIDLKNLEFIDFEEYNAIYDDAYFENRKNKISGWREINDPVEWLRKHRGLDE